MSQASAERQPIDRGEHAIDIAVRFDARKPGCTGDAEHVLAEVQAQRNFGERAEAVAHRNQAKRRARDDGIAGLAQAGRDHDADVRVGERRIGSGNRPIALSPHDATPSQTAAMIPSRPPQITA